jgi:hypothetical protein
MNEYRMTYAGFIPPSGGRDATGSHVLEIEGRGDRKSVRIDMSRTAFEVSKSRVGDPMALLLADALVRIEDVLRSGAVGLQQVEDASLHSSQTDRLEQMERSDKQCSWQSGTGSGLVCAAAKDMKVRPTTLAACDECAVLDQRWICAHFVHPRIVDAGTFDDAHARMFLDAQCNIGAGSAGKECFPGAHACWERRVIVVAREDSDSEGYVVDPNKPFSNKRAIRRLVREARGCMRWYERDMPAKALEVIADEVAETGATEIRLLSGDLERGKDRAGARARVRSDLEALRKEIATTGITIEWRELLAGSVPHDRVFLSDTASLNLPPLNTMLKGDTSEITPSKLTAEWFDDLWAIGAPVG